MTHPAIVRPLLIRPARADDRDTVLAFSRQTWSWGDYLEHVWDDWLAASDGRLLVGEVDGRPIAVGRGRLVAPGQGWLEGLRVDPRVRRSGVGGAMTEATLGAARELGATVVRFATRADAYPVHRIAERLGFVKVASYSDVGASALEGDGPQPVALDASEEERVWDLLSAMVIPPITWRSWHCRTLDRDEVARRVAAGEVYALPDDLSVTGLAAASFAVAEAEDRALVVDTATARDAQHLSALGLGLRRLAAARSLARVEFRAPETELLLRALATAGYASPGEGDVPFWVFEWRTTGGG